MRSWSVTLNARTGVATTWPYSHLKIPHVKLIFIDAEFFFSVRGFVAVFYILWSSFTNAKMQRKCQI
jgi:hypothetical protein